MSTVGNVDSNPFAPALRKLEPPLVENGRGTSPPASQASPACSAGATGGKAKVWGREPKYIKATYKTAKVSSLTQPLNHPVRSHLKHG